MIFDRFRIGTRLAIAFSLALLLILNMAALSLTGSRQLHQRLIHITAIGDAETALSNNMVAALGEKMIILRNVILLADAAQIKQQMARFDTLSSKYGEARNSLHATLSQQQGASSATMALLAAADRAAQRAAPVMEQIVSIALRDEDAVATGVLLTQLLPIEREWAAALAGLSEAKARQNGADAQAATAAYELNRTLTLAITVGSIIVGLWGGWAMTRSVTQPLQHAIAIADRVAAGALAPVPATQRQDEAGDLLRALARMNSKLADIVDAVRHGTVIIGTTSADIAAGSGELAQSTQEQLRSLHNTAAAMEQLTASVAQNAEHARQADILAANASMIATQGGQAVASVTATMASIAQASGKISDITALIDSIAFQTNILALNAAVEAARAGEQGRGFAVVAGEIRHLAQRSAAAAKQIKGLIDESSNRVADGSVRVQETGETMADVVSSVRSVAAIIADIARAGGEQSTGIEQVNDAIATLDTAARQNAAMAGLAAASSEALHHQAAELSNHISIFRLARTEVLAPAARTADSTLGKMAR